MRVLAQMAMVMNLDKCIGCHTCSVTCKQAWTNRGGVEYAWFNNVETRPGQGYPRTYQDQERWRGGWTLTRRGRLKLRSGGRIRRLLSLFSNPHLPELSDYYEPWTYDYQNLITAPAGDDLPTAKPTAPIVWSANWDDSLGGGPELAQHDPVLKSVSERIALEFKQAYMFYLPRICEHCLNPSCVAACPSGAIYKRTEDGIVLVDSDTCRSWRMCVTGCPYKKVFLNHQTGKAEKCTFCFPRIELGMPTVCAQTCVGRLRYIGLVLYDPDRVLEAASVRDDRELVEAHKRVLLDPHDPAVVAAARAGGMSEEWIQAAQRSPVYDLIFKYGLALPLHPEYRTLPMVWYIPPLSPVSEALRDTGFDGEDASNLFAAVDALRIPIGYLASLFTAGDPAPVREVLRRLAAMRAFMRDINLGGDPDESIPASVGMGGEQMYDMYRLLAIAKAEDRYVIPHAHREVSEPLPNGCAVEPGNGKVSLGLPTLRVGAP